MRVLCSFFCVLVKSAIKEERVFEKKLREMETAGAKTARRKNAEKLSRKFEVAKQIRCSYVQLNRIE